MEFPSITGFPNARSLTDIVKTSLCTDYILAQAKLAVNSVYFKINPAARKELNTITDTVL